MKSNFDIDSESHMSLIRNSITPYPDLSYWKTHNDMCLIHANQYMEPASFTNDMNSNQSNLNKVWKILNFQVKQLDEENWILKERLASISSIISPFYDTQHYIISFKNSKLPQQFAPAETLSSKFVEIGSSLGLQRNFECEHIEAKELKNKSDAFTTSLLDLNEKNKKSFNRILTEEADQIGEIALYFHINPHMSLSYKQDFMRTMRKFREYSSSPTLSAAKEFLNHLIKNSNLNSSTIEKHTSHLRSYFKNA